MEKFSLLASTLLISLFLLSFSEVKEPLKMDKTGASVISNEHYPDNTTLVRAGYGISQDTVPEKLKTKADKVKTGNLKRELKETKAKVDTIPANASKEYIEGFKAGANHRSGIVVDAEGNVIVDGYAKKREMAERHQQMRMRTDSVNREIKELLREHHDQVAKHSIERRRFVDSIHRIREQNARNQQNNMNNMKRQLEKDRQNRLNTQRAHMEKRRQEFDKKRAEMEEKRKDQKSKAEGNKKEKNKDKGKNKD